MRAQGSRQTQCRQRITRLVMQPLSTLVVLQCPSLKISVRCNKTGTRCCTAGQIAGGGQRQTPLIPKLLGRRSIDFPLDVYCFFPDICTFKACNFEEGEMMTRFTLRWTFLSVSLICATLMLMFFAVLPALAQTGSLGTVTGVVTDPSNAVVPDVTVTLTDKAINAVQTTTTNNAGRYLFVNVRPGNYEVAFTKTGFAKVSIPNDVVEVGMTSTNNVTLKVGTQSQTVEVEATGVELQTLNATVGTQISGLALNSLPTLARDTSTFLTLQSGISPDGSVAGTVNDQSSFQLDGGENTNDMDGSMAVYTTSYGGDPTGGAASQGVGGTVGPTGVMPTPADSVEEFKVNIAGQGADFNSSAGAQVQIVTKRGTDLWHGTAYEYYLDNNFNANTYENNFNGVPIPSYHYNRFGGAIGGPIIPKKILGGKTYFFANYEGFRFPQSQTIERAVPSARDADGLAAVPRCQRGGPGLQPQFHARYLQRCHLSDRRSARATPLQASRQAPATRGVLESTRWSSRCGTSTCRCRMNPDAAWAVATD